MSRICFGLVLVTVVLIIYSLNYLSSIEPYNRFNGFVEPITEQTDKSQLDNSDDHLMWFIQVV